MGILTHHSSDDNVWINKAEQCGGLTEKTILRGEPHVSYGELKWHVADNGWFQPTDHERYKRVILASLALIIVAFVHSIGTSWNESMFKLFQDENEFPLMQKITSILELFTMFLVVYFAFLQRLDLFGDIPGFDNLNTMMIIAYYLIVGICTIVYLGVMIPIAVQATAGIIGKLFRG